MLSVKQKLAHTPQKNNSSKLLLASPCSATDLAKTRRVKNEIYRNVGKDVSNTAAKKVREGVAAKD